MFDHLQIPDARERALVGAADLALRPLQWGRRARPVPVAPERVLLMRLERIGDLLMVLDAIADARAAWPEATIDLAVGSWNSAVARLIPGITRVHVADVPWLARGGSGHSWRTLLAKAQAWRRLDYDLIVNFEPDIRSNALAWRAGRRIRAGYWTGGGRAFLTHGHAYDPSVHVSANARRLIADVSGQPMPRFTFARVPHLVPPDSAFEHVDDILAGTRRPLVGMHVAGGRASKQWHLDRFAIVARTLALEHRATIVLTGGSADRPLVDLVQREIGQISALNLVGALDLPALAALMSRLDVLITGDTGPMHVAAAMGTPVVALFGPSNPVRYGPRGDGHAVLRVDLPCSPCGRVRLPPERCRGHVPDCMDGIQVESVVDAAIAILKRGATTVEARHR